MSATRSVAKTGAGAGGIPAGAPEWPVLPPWLRRYAEALLEPDGERRALVMGSLGALRDADRAIAARAAEIMDEWLVPAGREVITRWLQPIYASVEQRSRPATEDAMAAFVTAVAMLGIPERCFTADAQRVALRSWTWWPSVERIAEVVEPTAVRLRRIRDTLRRMAESQAAPRPGPRAAEPPENLSAEVRAAVVERFRVRWASEIAAPIDRARASARVDSRPRAAPLSDGVLLDTYRATAARGGPGAAAAAFRADQIEARLRASIADC